MLSEPILVMLQVIVINIGEGGGGGAERESVPTNVTEVVVLKRYRNN